MWLNEEQIIDSAIHAYREDLLNSIPNYIVVDNLFDTTKLEEVMAVLHQESCWQVQTHTYSALYVDNAQWQNTSMDQRFVQREVWQRKSLSSSNTRSNRAGEFLAFLRGDEFMSLLSRIFNVPLTDINVAKPEINTNYYRLNATDFINQHADDSPGRVVCMLLYLNREWRHNSGGELVFLAEDNDPIDIAPLYNRCVLFDPSSKGSEHWVKEITSESATRYRYNVTSWYWSE
jgi:SM-20-related protein